jgi:hypothetical protein
LPWQPFGPTQAASPSQPGRHPRLGTRAPGFNAMREFLPDLNRLTGQGTGKRLPAGLREANGEKICLPFAQPLK